MAKGGFFKKIFKRKPGGTFVGNLLRMGAKSVSGGLLGNGAMMLKPGETTEDANERLAKTIGSAAAGAKTGMAVDNAATSFMDKVKQGSTKTIVIAVLALVALVGGAIAIFRKKK